MSAAGTAFKISTFEDNMELEKSKLNEVAQSSFSFFCKKEETASR